jgi:signal transduction histidine kinase
MKILPREIRHVVLVVILGLHAAAGAAQMVTNLAELQVLAASGKSVVCDIRLEALVCSVDPSGHQFVLVDDSGAEVVRVDSASSLVPGAEINLAGSNCLVRQKSWGVSLASPPLIDNDGLHGAKEKSAKIFLQSGRVPLRVEWFNASQGSALELAWRPPGAARENLPAAQLVCRDRNQNWTNGMAWKCYEGSWETLPEFADLPAVADGVTTNFTLDVATRHDFVGLAFEGFLEVPRTGEYEFFLKSDDGGKLFLGDSVLKISELSRSQPPEPRHLKIGTSGLHPGWAEVAGVVDQIRSDEDAVELILNSADGSLRVRIPGAASPPVFAPGTAVTARGVSCDAFRADGTLGFGVLEAASLADVRVQASGDGTAGLLTSTAAIARLSRAEAERGQPVKLRGVITCDASWLYAGGVLQDRTRGIYCFWPETNAATGRLQRRPRFGEYWEIEGFTAPGNFAPSVRATNMTFLGEGELPAPVTPARDQLLNGSLDTQFVEITGIITDADTNGVVLLTHQGKIRVNMPALAPSLRSKVNYLVRLRGCLMALWDWDTRQVKLGEMRLGNATASFDAGEAVDPFSAPLKSVGDLLRFDVAAGSLQRVKIAGQITGKRGEEFFLLEGRQGLRFVPRDSVKVQAGELVEVSGFPELDGPSPVLREAVVRRTGSGPLPEPVRLKPADLFRLQNDGQIVKFEAVFNGLRAAAGETLLDLQSGGNYFSARVRIPASAMPEIQPGSRVEIAGLFVALSSPGRLPGRHLGAFEIILSAPDSLRVIARPPWWTLQRLLVVTGVLCAVLILAALWISQLRLRVEERTAQLRHEISERERAEQSRVVQEERTRIAQDLHDDLGSSLTEISVLASAGRRSPAAAAQSGDLFDAISEKSRRLVSALDAIVWAIDPKENTLQSLVDYLAGYVEDYLSTNNITCRFKLPDEVPAAVVEGKLRHELFLVVKEALHNIVRHARATEVEFHLALAGSKLEIVIRDNGCGFDPEIKGGGHGLKNFAGRMARLGGECVVTSQTNGGTAVKLNLSFSVPQTGSKSAE